MRIPWIVLVLLVAGAVAGGKIHAVPQVQQFVEMPRGMAFYDFRLFNTVVVDYRKGSPLYQVEKERFFDPGSAVYKYPPPYAALLSLSADVRWRPVARRFLALDTFCIFLAWGLFSVDAIARSRSASSTSMARVAGEGGGRSRWWDPAGPLARSVGLLAIVILWKPFYESLAGIQLEPLFLPFFVLALIGLERGWGWIEGVAIGIGAVFKVYPALLGMGVLLEKKWRSISAGMAAGVALLVFGALRFSWGETWFYFTKVLPKLGGTSVVLENLSVAGQVGSVLVHGYSAPELDRKAGVATLEMLGDPFSIWTTRIVAALVAVVLVAVTWRTLRRVAPERRGPARLAASIPLLLFLMPTSWFDYQTLLFVPAAWLFLRLPFERRHLVPWTVLGLSMLPLLVVDANRMTGATQAWVSATRALASVGLWGSVLLGVRAYGSYERSV